MSYIVPIKQIATPTTGTTVTIANADGDIRLILNPAGTLLALTVAFPSAPHDGQVLDMACSQIITGLTSTSGGTILGTLTTMAAVNGFASWVYDLAGTKWYRVN